MPHAFPKDLCEINQLIQGVRNRTHCCKGGKSKEHSQVPKFAQKPCSKECGSPSVDYAAKEHVPFWGPLIALRVHKGNQAGFLDPTHLRNRNCFLLELILVLLLGDFEGDGLPRAFELWSTEHGFCKDDTHSEYNKMEYPHRANKENSMLY